jgi:hypothetical protein
VSSLRRSLPSQQQPPEEAPSVAPRAQEPEAASNEEVRAQLDTGGHIDAGDSVAGEAVVVNGITFSPGELASLVDYVGDLGALPSFAAWELLGMKHLLASRSEDAAAWDRVTHGAYSRLAQDNDDHFAPGAGGPDHVSSFLDAFAAAFGAAQLAQQHCDGDEEHEHIMTEARLHLYTAEHYLEDMFSAGHQVAASDVEASVDAVLSAVDFSRYYPRIAREVFEREGDFISRFGVQCQIPVVGTVYDRIDTLLEWTPIAVTGAEEVGRDGVVDAVRKSVHEALEVGVEVQSEAHPEPWVLLGDHDLFASDESVAALQLALSEVRAAIELEAVPGVDGRKTGERLLSRPRPVPTAAGRAQVDRTLAEMTASPDALAAAVADATCSTIDAVMDTIVARSGGWIVEIPEPEEEAQVEAPPEGRRSYVPGF